MGSLVSRIDLNADVGERPAALRDGSERSLIRLVTSANIACGGHAGDEESMRSVIEACKTARVAVGAHPGFPDRDGFGRQPMAISDEALEASLRQQIQTLVRIASELGVGVRHVKPHGALYNIAAFNISLAEVIGRAVGAIDKRFVLVGLAGALALDVWKKMGFVVIGEGFADRRYEPDGSLRARALGDAVIEDPDEAGRQAIDIACRGEVETTDGSWIAVPAQTLCVHGDTKNAAVIAAAVRHALVDKGIQICSFSSSPH